MHTDRDSLFAVRAKHLRGSEAAIDQKVRRKTIWPCLVPPVSLVCGAMMFLAERVPEDVPARAMTTAGRLDREAGPALPWR